MRIGRLDRRIRIESKTSVGTASGSFTESWTELATVWARKITGRGREFFQHAETQNDQQAEFVIRNRTDVTTQMRVVDLTDDRNYDIESISDEFRRKGEMHLFCLLRDS